MSDEIPVKKIVWSVIGILGLFILTIIGCSSYEIVDAGYVGVKRNWGAIHKESVGPGLRFKIPIMQDIIEMETRLKSFEIKAPAASKDLQKVETIISIQHSLNPVMAPDTLQQIGDLDKCDITIVNPAVLECFKAVCSKYTAEELITKREIVKTQISDSIQTFIDHTLKDKGVPGAIHISNVAIKDFDFSAQFNSAIEAKVTAQQEALKAETEKTKRITNAEASAKEIELAADAEAYQIEKQSISRAAAIEREAKAIAANPLLLELRAIEKWDGKLPTFSMSGGTVPFINLDKVVK